MTREEFERLREGDIVRSKLSGDSYVVTANCRGRVTAVRTADLTNPDEWEVVPKPPNVRAGRLRGGDLLVNFEP